MSIMRMPNPPERTYKIAVDIGQYHFITWDGWHVEWVTRDAKEWWAKRQWEREGGHSQDEDIDYNNDTS